jgi:hypothetical protein
MLRELLLGDQMVDGKPQLYHRGHDAVSVARQPLPEISAPPPDPV